MCQQLSRSAAFYGVTPLPALTKLNWESGP